MEKINQRRLEGLLKQPPPKYTSGMEKVKPVPAKGPISRPSSVYTLSGHPPVGPVPLKVTCPHCGGYQLSSVVWQVTLRTHFAALICCVLGLWCLLPAPYLMKGFKHAYHYCKICDQFIESYPAQ